MNTTTGSASPPPLGSLERCESLLIQLSEALSKLALAETETLTMFEDLSGKLAQTLAAKQAASRLEPQTNGTHL